MLDETKKRIKWALKSERDFNRLSNEKKDLILKEIFVLFNRRINLLMNIESLSRENAKILAANPIMLLRSE